MSILPVISKIFERIIFNQISSYIDRFLSPFLSGFRQRFSTQHIAKLNVYGFGHESLGYICSYLSERKQRTKINNSFSSWSYIYSGVPQGSILGPLLFNIYLNDIFFFINESELTNYADDNTPYAMEPNIEGLICTLEANTSITINWFYENYFKMNADKCHLLVCNHSDKLSVDIDNEII